MQLNGEQNWIMITAILAQDFTGIKELIIFWTGSTGNATPLPARHAASSFALFPTCYTGNAHTRPSSTAASRRLANFARLFLKRLYNLHTLLQHL
jgi:hypothetical protein